MMVQGRAIRINESVVVAELDNETVLLDVDAGIYYGLNELGSQIWKLLVEGKSEDEIVADLLAEYEVDVAALRQDVVDFLDRLSATGLATPRND